MSAVLRMGGDTELAARVRPSPRRAGQTVELAEGDAPPSSPAPTTDA